MSSLIKTFVYGPMLVSAGWVLWTLSSSEESSVWKKWARVIAIFGGTVWLLNYLITMKG